MRKILAGFMATSMIVAMASATTFAANASFSVGINNVSATTAPDAQNTSGLNPYNAVVPGNIDPYSTTGDGKGSQKYSGTLTIDVTAEVRDPSGSLVKTAPTVKVSGDYNGVIDLENGNNGGRAAKVTPQAPTTSIKSTEIAKAVAKAIGTVTVKDNGNVYVLTASASGSDVVLTADGASIPAGITLTVSYSDPEVSDFTSDSIAPVAVYGTAAPNAPANVTVGFAAPITVALNDTFRTSTSGKIGGDEYADVDKSGTLESCNISEVIVCDGDSNPIVYTEHKVGVDEDQNTEKGVQSAKTLYFMLRDDDKAPIPKLNDDTYWKLKITKGDNGKYVKAITDVSKTFKDGLYPINSSVIDGDTIGRHRFIKVELNEIYTDDEYKITLDMRITAKSKAVNAKLLVKGQEVTDDSEFKVKDFYFYMKNLVKDADNDWKVGIDGLMLNPLENDWNDVTWFDEDGDVAHMKFFADSDVGKFYSKLSTKWEHADYASYFNDQDAFIFNFTGSPKLSSTSRADLEIYNPFVDEDGNSTIDPATAVVYQVIDGDLYDVTDSFEYKEGENGDMAYVTRTRFLGTYIICEKAVEEAVSDETVPDELTPDTDTTAPEDVTPDNNGGGKTPANTGRYL